MTPEIFAWPSLSFAYPAALILLLAPAALLVWIWRREGRRVALPFDHGNQPAGHSWAFVIGLAESLPALILAVVILLLAGPQRLGEPRSQRSLTNIEFCVDISGSMTAPFGSGTRYDASMDAINEFLDYREGDAFGLTFFGNNVLHWVPLTTDVSAVKCAPPFMRPEIAPPWFGGTMIGKALMACRKTLADRDEGDRMIVLVSDGMSFDLTSGVDEQIARTLRDENIIVYAIHINESPVPDTIVNIASRTGGEVFAPGDTSGLEAVFQRIDSMRQAKLVRTVAEMRDDFAPYCLAGLSILSLGGLALFGLRYTPW